MVDRPLEALVEPDRRTWRVAQTISWCADHATVARLAKPLAFSSIAGRIGTHRRRRRTRIVGLAALTVAALFGAWTQRHHRDVRKVSLTFTIDGALAPQSGYVAAARTAQTMLSFSDGSHIQMEPGARGRVIDLNSDGARIILEEGRANVQVARRPGSHWQFAAGPFLVTVHGTAFSFGWDPLDAHFDIHMRSGAVSVSGASSDGDIFLRDTQSLSVTLNDDGDFTASAIKSDGLALARSLNVPPTAASAKALGWYERYLKEAPTGAFGADAVGRHMVLLDRIGHRAEATRLAIDYLLRSPYGAYSHTAEALVHAP